MIALQVSESYLRKYIRYYHRDSVIRGRILLSSASLIKHLFNVSRKNRDIRLIDTNDIVFFDNRKDDIALLDGKEAVPLISHYDSLLKQSFRSYMAGAMLANPGCVITDLIRNWLDEFNAGDDDKLVSRLRKDWHRHRECYTY